MARTNGENPDKSGSAADRLKEELSSYLSSQVGRLAERAGEALSGGTGNGSGSLPGIASRVLKGENPAKAFVSEKAKGVKENVVDTAKSAFGGEGGDRKAGSVKVTSIIETLDVGVPLRTAYDHWTAYDKFNEFTKGVTQVSKGDDAESDWKVKIAFSNRSFKATVQEQVPDDRIVWTSEGAKGSTRGVVSFHELAPSLTRIVLVVEYYPSGFFEKTGNLWRAQGRRMRLDFKHFQRYVTFTDEEPEGWRGEIRDGEVVRTHEEAIEEEEAEREEGEEYEDDEDEEYDEDGEDEEEDGEYEDEDEEYEDEEDDYEDEEQDETRPRRRAR